MLPYELMAGLLDYPDAGLAGKIEACRASLAAVSAEAAGCLERFRAAIETLGPGAREELYTAAFDMAADGSLYVGHHLFGEDARRGVFLVKLKEFYRAHGFDSGRELPDHLGVMLRFLAARGRDEETSELIQDCMLPALAKALRASDQTAPAYAAVLKAILIAIEGETRS